MSSSLPISVEDLNNLQEECLGRLKNDELHHLRNDAKLRAVYTSKSYDEFKDIVDAAHLKPITRKDKSDATTRSRLWNSAAKED
ncbi:coiled-coil domain-containing protein 103 [Episyrphus balteatus]|uniref:coiled-coil domain-containing protein 103 n=1 Tax=Episyrphus balteatus TaxID=286459 RepID=UPI002485A118|nr:coiled-coil domain-containing protein 103 [Episyrphus balteatus]